VGAPDDRLTRDNSGITEVKNTASFSRDVIRESAIFDSTSRTGRAKIREIMGAFFCPSERKFSERKASITQMMRRDKKEIMAEEPPERADIISERNALGESLSDSVSAENSMPSGMREKNSFMKDCMSNVSAVLKEKMAFLQIKIVI
jgi:hypothetical protein